MTDTTAETCPESTDAIDFALGDGDLRRFLQTTAEYLLGPDYAALVGTLSPAAATNTAIESAPAHVGCI